MVQQDARAHRRREIGHGALGERALAQIIPSEEDLHNPLSSRSVRIKWFFFTSKYCAGTLALMDAGVPIKAPVAGIAMGLVSDGENYTILTDIQGLKTTLAIWTLK